MVAFCASIVRGQINLLPPNKKSLTLLSLSATYKDCYLVHDAAAPLELPQLPQLDLAKLVLSGGSKFNAIPDIPLDQLAAISFTSGSTGDSQPNLKCWRVIVESSRNNANYMLAEYRNQLVFQLATVPPQHMWGVETSVLLPLSEPVCVADCKPLFPIDIAEALAELPQPRMMVSTPVHLRALCSTQLAFPPLDLILCATSPLDQRIAKLAEARFFAELREVYGCSEIGSMAIRRTSMDPAWTLFSGIDVDVQETVATAATSYLPNKVVLQDRLTMLDSGQFQLSGRASDMVDVAGKRGSLFEINKILMDFPGIIDGIVFLPDSEHAICRLAGMVVLNSNDGIDQLKSYLRQHLDDAFIPRPLLKIKKLPREENGKLPLTRLKAFYREVIDKRSSGVATTQNNDQGSSV
jgi:acyl-coenzyme A synthetase/AMP-(fatty) acid ligase